MDQFSVTLKHYSPGSWALLEGNDGNFYMNVMCGSVALYPVDFQLTDSERAQYLKENVDFLLGLAAKVRNRPSDFAARPLDKTLAWSVPKNNKGFKKRY